MSAYWIERLPLRFFAPVALALAAPSHIGRPLDVPALAADAAFALLLIAQFRLWDDLADRERDAVAHPERVLCRAPSVAPYVAMTLLLAAGTLAAIVVRDGTAPALAIFGAVAIPLAALYGLRRGRSLAGDLVILAKYPAFVWIVAVGRPGASPAAITAGAAAVFVAACLYEAWHDSAAPLRLLLRSSR